MSEPRVEWYAVWTRSRCEQLVRDGLAAKGFEVFFPKINQWTRRGGVRSLCPVPLFPGYLFLHHAMDQASYREVVKVRGLVGVLGERWDRLAAVPETEIDAIVRALRGPVAIAHHAYLREGQRVRVTRGPLMGLEGILVRSKPNQGVLVVSLHLLQRSVAVQVDCTAVTAA
jgi:transcription termination/antitermination protein NusG